MRRKSLSLFLTLLPVAIAIANLGGMCMFRIGFVDGP